MRPMPSRPFHSQKTADGAHMETTPPALSALIIPSSGGEVVVATPADKELDYDTLHYAPARRIGNVLYVSGVIVERLQDEHNDTAAFKDQIRRGFHKLEATLHAAGATFTDVAMMNSFHVWDSAQYTGSKTEHLEAFASIKDEFLRQPYPGWTAIGTTALATNGLVEIQLVAHLSSGMHLA